MRRYFELSRDPINTAGQSDLYMTIVNEKGEKIAMKFTDDQYKNFMIQVAVAYNDISDVEIYLSNSEILNIG